MHPYPHHYAVRATGGAAGEVALDAGGLPTLASAPPVEFDGPGDRWSPETMLVGAVADCFLLTFRAVARAARFDWLSLECSVDGTLDRVEGAARFTHMLVTATLRVAREADRERAVKLLEKAEHGCLISRSLLAERTLRPTVVVG
ncbi:MAG TPA: OsmC family protein [Steroidobacteraceae bacterium]|nr:OsmC family protein [Steroidobacteraceae bacterium]